MYGDSESCDSTIKLGEFCSWRGVVPLTLPSLPSLPPPPPPAAPSPAPSRASLAPLSFPPFRGYLRFDSPYLPSHPQLCRSFSRVPRLGPYPENYPLPCTVKDSRTERPRTPASHLLLAAVVSGDGVGSIFYQSNSRNLPKPFFLFVARDYKLVNNLNRY